MDGLVKLGFDGGLVIMGWLTEKQLSGRDYTLFSEETEHHVERTNE